MFNLKEEKQARHYFKKYELKGKWPCFFLIQIQPVKNILKSYIQL